MSLTLSTRSFPLTAGLLLLASLACLPSLAQAATYKVYSPRVVYGETELEARAFLNQDEFDAVDRTGALKLAYGYAFTKNWKTEVYGEIEYNDGVAEFEALEWENILQLTPQGKYWVDLGLLAELEVAVEADHPHGLKVGPIIEKSFGKTVATVNLTLEREFGPNHSEVTDFAYAARLRWRMGPGFEPAIEAYGSRGILDGFKLDQVQRHQAGPAFYGQLDLGNASKIVYSAAALRGLTDSDSPDWTYVLRFEYEYF